MDAVLLMKTTSIFVVSAIGYFVAVRLAEQPFTSQILRSDYERFKETRAYEITQLAQLFFVVAGTILMTLGFPSAEQRKSIPDDYVVLTLPMLIGIILYVLGILGSIIGWRYFAEHDKRIEW